MEEDENISSDGSVPKSPSAVDYYDISEVCEDEPASSSASNSEQGNENSASKNNGVSVSGDIENAFHNRFCKLDENSSSTDRTISGKPLASVLPAKYRNVDVKTLFPEFSDGNLRFLRLFGLGKPSSMPDIWRSVRKKGSENASVLQSVKELEVESDEETKFLQHKETVPGSCIDGSSQNDKVCNNEWRNGPAKLWYDMAEVPENVETYDYGFKLGNNYFAEENLDYQDDIPADAFFMVTQESWEDNVIWDGDEAREEIMKNAFNLNKPAGWIPVSSDRTCATYREHCKIMSKEPRGNPDYRREMSESIFPEENKELMCDLWEDKVIWDSEAMNTIPYPQPLESNSDVICAIPEDKSPTPPNLSEVANQNERKDKNSVPVANKPGEEEKECSTNVKRNFYNISNDEYYNRRVTQETAFKFGSNLLQHSIPAVELRPEIFPSHLTIEQLRSFHRPSLRDCVSGPTSRSKFHGVHSLSKFIRQKELERQKESEAIGGGFGMFFMRNLSDLSGKDGTLVLFEFSEEHPPLMSQIGMASIVKNYYRRTPGKDVAMPDYKYGEIAYAHTSPFLGTLQPGQSIQAYENNLFRAPIYEHTMRGTDFLILRTKYNYYIREVETVYTVGQELPLVEVPTPKSDKANNFVRDFLMVYIYRLFWKSEDIPRRLKMEAIKTSFPGYREFNIRKRLGTCAVFLRAGNEPRCWALREGFRLPSEEEIRQMVSPEQCCSFYSMLAAEQRLRDAGYGEKFLLMSEDEINTLQNKFADEIKAAPWNTTQSFLSSIKGKCLLELWGSADPTGCGEGLSYVKVPNKPQFSKDENGVQSLTKRLVKGTDADLRRLSLTKAKRILKCYNIPDQEIKGLTRWQIIDVVRTISTEQAKMGEEGITKFARGNLFSRADNFRKYTEECQRLFDLQNRVLSSAEVLSTDEDSSSEDESDLEEMGKHLESIISNKKSMEELSHENEEAEREELMKKLMNSNEPKEEIQKDKLKENNVKAFEGKVMHIYRTYVSDDGSKFIRIETVRRPEVIQLYTHLRETKPEEFIRNYSLDEAQKEEMRKERRRIQDQLRRIKRNELKENNKEQPKKRIKLETPQSLKVRCGACGAFGHMRTNKSCPLYESSPSLPPVLVAMTEEQEEAEEKAALDDQNLIKVDETKIILSKQLIKQADEIRRKSLVLKFPKEAVMVPSKKRRERFEEPTSDFLSTPKVVNRKRVDPVVAINVLFEKIIGELKSLPNTRPFWIPVNAKEVPNYHIVIKKPMDLRKMKDKVLQHQYKSREAFLLDLQQIVDNSNTFNGPHSFYSVTAQTMLEHSFKRLNEEEDKLMDLEKAINPLLDSPQVAFSFLLETIVSDHLKSVPESWPFHKPVDKRSLKSYYSLVKKPMDLDTLIKNCKSQRYETVSAFLSDVQLIHSNSLEYNGPESQFTKIAQEIVNTCQASIEMYLEQLEKLELEIQETDHGAPVNNSKLPSKRIKFVVKPVVQPPQSTSNCNGGTIDNDLIVDVESMDTGVKNSVEKEINFFENYNLGEENVRNYELEDSNSYLLSSALEYDLELRSRDSASLSVPTKMQSLLPSNGITTTDNSSDYPGNVEPYSSINCDIICDDLRLSESDSDEEMHTL